MMPQLSLYLDDDIHRELEARARINKSSISKFVVNILKTHFSTDWPDGYQNLYGSINDESFIKHEAPDWSLDITRAEL